MVLNKTNEKIIVWMHRTNTSMQMIATECGLTRQAISQQLKDNVISFKVIQAVKKLGFSE